MIGATPRPAESDTRSETSTPTLRTVEPAGGELYAIGESGWLIGAIASAHAWYEELRDGAVGSMRKLAKRVGCDRADVGRTIRLAFLAPDIVEAILSGRQPADLTLTRLKRLGDLPLSWSEQRALFRFDL